MSKRDLVVTENITLDGVIDAADGWFAPSSDNAEADQSDIVDAIREQRDAADALLVGRITFEQMREYWPLQTKNVQILGFSYDSPKVAASRQPQRPVPAYPPPPREIYARLPAA